eukprot:jgi/Mesvir1/4283/Mv22241-RA.1
MVKGIGGFGGLFPFGDHYLVAGTDGVGTKLKLAFEMNKHDTIGIDLVAMSVNDIVTLGAKPLFFLDYYGTSKLDVDVAEMVIKGMVDGCQESDCALLGGETAEMPGFYGEGEYDLSGFAVGAVKKTDVIDGSKVVLGDVLLGLPSSGLHSNGFSLARRVVQVSGMKLSDKLPGGDGASIGETMLRPTKLYVRPVMSILEAVGTGGLHGIAHITGGGITDNLPRVIPKGLGATVNRNAWTPPPIFAWMQKTGKINNKEMYRTFNMGIGLILVCSPKAAEVLKSGKVPGVPVAIEIGRIAEGDGVMYSPPL